MFDIGFTELLIIGVVALFVIGPEDLPEAVRTAAGWLNRIRRSFSDIKRELQQELHNDAVLRDLRDSGRALRDETDNLRQQFQKPLEELAAGETITPGKGSAEKPSEQDSASPSSVTPDTANSGASEHRD